MLAFFRALSPAGKIGSHCSLKETIMSAIELRGCQPRSCARLSIVYDLPWFLSVGCASLSSLAPPYRGEQRTEPSELTRI
jgi:hypothetical protein